MPDGTKIDKAWEQLFDQHRILAQVDVEGSFRISSTQINEAHQARLMVKFDQSAHLPEIFRKHQLSILPITRGDYLIGPFVTHKKIGYRAIRPKQVEIPPLETIDAKNLYSEAATLSFAYNSGIINDIMDSDKVKFTVNGRMGSGKFSFLINNRQKHSSFPVLVRSSQIEIDAGFESPDAFVVCEAKNRAPRELAPQDFLIRQLYYPYRLWCNKISKPVIPVLLVFSNDIFHVFIYEFKNIQNYNSITLKDYREYTFADEDISLQDIIRLWRSTKVVEEPNVPFPQANSFQRVLGILSALHEKELTRSDVTRKYEFVPRQADYYVTACEYLGLIEQISGKGNESEYQLTPEARRIMSLSYKNKHLALMKKVFERSVFNKAFGIFVNSNELPDASTIFQIMKSTDFPIKMSDTTMDRRSSTVLSWLNWMIKISVAD